ncbi:DUF7520 family protein [Halomarina litorea]|uniref:DUF7520 family protein n=1 Tax=Halomarina litorea TaxID=2961595 RepID=UPI0020C4255F|nr:hypothetical protein [Halomarina sp. BCD28]
MVSRPNERRSGRKILLVIAVVAVVIGAVFGYVIGLVAPGVFGQIELAGTTLFSPTPSGFATYGALATAAALGVLFALVHVVSRFDTDAR